MPAGERRLTAIMFTDVVGYTALMGADEQRALAVVAESRRLIEASATAHGGRFLEYEGDGTLSTFASAVEAVAAATEIQQGAQRSDLAIRIGVHVGDVLESGDQIMGDGVNVAARICALADAGQLYVSDTVYDQVRNQPNIQARNVGTPSMKNVDRSIVVWSIGETGDAVAASPRAKRSRLKQVGVGAVVVAALLAVTLALIPALRNSIGAKLVLGAMAANLERETAFTRSADGTRIAWASVGQGMPVVQVQVWSTHVDYGPIIPFESLDDFLDDHRVVYYDGRGFGLSQRNVEHSPDKRLEDLEAVVDASGLERFALWGFSAGTPIALAYAAKHPERVSHLVLYGTLLRAPLDEETTAATIALVSKHSGSSELVFRQFFRGLFIPDASDFEMSIFEELMSDSGGTEDAAAFVADAFSRDVSALAAEIKVPTLVLHRRNDVAVPFEFGVEVAGLIDGAKFEALAGKNHVFLPGEEEGDRTMQSIAEFLATTPE